MDNMDKESPVFFAPGYWEGYWDGYECKNNKSLDKGTETHPWYNKGWLGGNYVRWDELQNGEE